MAQIRIPMKIIIAALAVLLILAELACATGAPQAEDPPPLQPGETGPAVEQLQRALRQIDLYKGEINGVFDAPTQAAVISFQRAVYIPVTGSVDALTWRNLREAVAQYPLIIGYYGNGGAYDSYPVLRDRGNQMTAIAPVWFWVERDGRIRGDIDPATIELARSQGVRLLGLISNLKYDTNTSKEQARAILNDPELGKKVIENIIRLVERFDLDGINLDFEYIQPEDRQDYSLFCTILGKYLKDRGRWFTISVAAKTSDKDFSYGFNGGFDYKALGVAADHLMLMAYDRHYAGGPPGPVAPLTWVNEVVRYAKSQVSPRKLVLGINAYGYDWHSPNARARAIVMRNVSEWAAARGAKLIWDPVEHVLYARYTSGGSERQAWLENAQSIGWKMDLIRYHKIAGLAWWRMGYEDESFWETLHARWPYPTTWQV